MKKEIAIFTPTYNRKDNLSNVYQSLLKQSSNNFEWYIIDDGSEDDTEKIVNNFILEKKIKINYIKKANGGKHTAFNLFIENVKNEFCLISLDSDDILVEDAISFLEEQINKLCNDENGVVCLRSNNSNERDNTCKKYNLKELTGKSLSDALCNNLYDAECIFLFKTDYLKKFKFPEIKGERFFTEAYIYYQIEGKMLWTDKIIEVGTYLDDGLTKNTTKLFYKSPNSWRLYNEIRMKKNKNLLKKIKFTIYFISFSILSNKNPFKKNNKFIITLLYPIGFLGAKYIKKKGDV